MQPDASKNGQISPSVAVRSVNGGDSRPRRQPGALELLEKLSSWGVKLGICTTKPIKLTEKLIRELNVRQYFDSVFGGDSVSTRKPDGRHLLATIAALNVQPDVAVMVGDTNADVETARNAGVPVIVVSFGYSSVPARCLGADDVIDSFDQLTSAMSRIAGHP